MLQIKKNNLCIIVLTNINLKYLKKTVLRLKNKPVLIVYFLNFKTLLSCQKPLFKNCK